MERLASVVAALPAAHVPRILKQLPSMVQVGDGKWSFMSMELLVSAWVGLEAAIHWGPEIGKKVFFDFSFSSQSSALVVSIIMQDSCYIYLLLK